MASSESSALRRLYENSPSLKLLSARKLRTLIRSGKLDDTLPTDSMNLMKGITESSLAKLMQSLEPEHAEARATLHTKQKKSKRFFRITDPVYTFQIDVVFFRKYKKSNHGVDRLLVLVDVLSRKAYAIPMANGRINAILDSYKKFEREISPKVPVKIVGDNEFNNAQFREYLQSKGTTLNTIVAAHEHEGDSHSLGILDRFVRTLRSSLKQWILVHHSQEWLNGLKDVLKSYNDDSVHPAHGKTPSDVFDDMDDLLALRFGDALYNARLKHEMQSKSIPVGTHVRIVRKPSEFEKASEAPRLSVERYKVTHKVGHNKYTIEGKDRAYNANELVHADALQAANAVIPALVERDSQQHILRQSRRLRKEGVVDEVDEDALRRQAQPKSALEHLTSNSRPPKRSAAIAAAAAVTKTMTKKKKKNSKGRALDTFSSDED